MKSSKQLIRIFCITTSLASVSVSAIALPLHSETTALQPIIEKNPKGFSSCAVRAVVGVVEKDYLNLYDITLGVDVDMVSGVLVVGKRRSPMDDLEKVGKRTWKIIEPAPTMAWIAQEEGEGKVISHNKTPGEPEDGSLSGITDIVPAYAGIMSIIHGERMLLAVKYQDQPDFTVIKFSANMEKNHRVRLKACLSGVVKRLKN